MEIIPIISDAKDEISKFKKHYKPKIFTKLPFTSLLYGSSGVGKSTMIANILIRNYDNLLTFYKPE
jgi:putative ribosome biogenesis GTPase RsgA